MTLARGQGGRQCRPLWERGSRKAWGPLGNKSARVVARRRRKDRTGGKDRRGKDRRRDKEEEGGGHEQRALPNARARRLALIRPEGGCFDHPNRMRAGRTRLGGGGGRRTDGHLRLCLLGRGGRGRGLSLSSHASAAGVVQGASDREDHRDEGESPRRAQLDHRGGRRLEEHVVTGDTLGRRRRRRSRDDA